MHFEWHIVPTGAHSYIGSVKRQVGMVKRVLNRKLSGAVVNHNDLLLLTAETAKILNSKPLNYATQCNLLGGRVNDGICSFEPDARTKSLAVWIIWRS